MYVPVQGQTVTIEGREGQFVVIRVNTDLNVADILTMANRGGENIPLQAILIPAR